jgi:hypothetical protein
MPDLSPKIPVHTLYSRNTIKSCFWGPSDAEGPQQLETGIATSQNRGTYQPVKKRQSGSSGMKQSKRWGLSSKREGRQSRQWGRERRGEWELRERERCVRVIMASAKAKQKRCLWDTHIHRERGEGKSENKKKQIDVCASGFRVILHLFHLTQLDVYFYFTYLTVLLQFAIIKPFSFFKILFAIWLVIGLRPRWLLN